MVTARIPVPRVATGLAVTPDGRTLYVSTYGAVVAVDLATNRVVATVAAHRPVQVAVSHDGAFAYAADYDAGTLLVIDTASNMLVANIAVGSIPSMVAVAPEGGRVYVLPPWGASAVWLIDTASRRVTSITPGGYSLDNVALSPDGSRAYVMNTAYTDEILVLDTSANTLVTHIPLDPAGVIVPPGTGRVAVSPDRTTLFAPTNPVAVIDARKGVVPTTISLPTS